MKSFDDTWSPDLIDMNDYGPKNKKGYRYILVVIFSFGKCGWRIPLRSKYAQSITDAIPQTIKTTRRKPNLFESDDRKEYVNNIFSDFMERNISKKILAVLMRELFLLNALIKQYVIY